MQLLGLKDTLYICVCTCVNADLINFPALAMTTKSLKNMQVQFLCNRPRTQSLSFLKSVSQYLFFCFSLFSVCKRQFKIYNLHPRFVIPISILYIFFIVFVPYRYFCNKNPAIGSTQPLFQVTVWDSQWLDTRDSRIAFPGFIGKGLSWALVGTFVISGNFENSKA